MHQHVEADFLLPPHGVGDPFLDSVIVISLIDLTATKRRPEVTNFG